MLQRFSKLELKLVFKMWSFPHRLLFIVSSICGRRNGRSWSSMLTLTGRPSYCDGRDWTTAAFHSTHNQVLFDRPPFRSFHFSLYWAIPFWSCYCHTSPSHDDAYRNRLSFFCTKERRREGEREDGRAELFMFYSVSFTLHRASLSRSWPKRLMVTSVLLLESRIKNEERKGWFIDRHIRSCSWPKTFWRIQIRYGCWNGGLERRKFYATIQCILRWFQSKRLNLWEGTCPEWEMAVGHLYVGRHDSLTAPFFIDGNLSRWRPVSVWS